MFIQSIPSGPYFTNAYVIGCALTKQAAVIDPSPNSLKSIQDCLQKNGFACDKILLTHSHWDHIADVEPLKKLYPKATIYVHPLDAPNLIEPGSDGLPLRININGIHPNQFLQEDDVLVVGEHSFKVIHTPGHSAGSVCFYFPKENVLFSGDTLFKGTIGNISFPTSRPDLMWTSLAKLDKLPGRTIVYPGHGPATTIASESWLPRAKEMFG